MSVSRRGFPFVISMIEAGTPNAAHPRGEEETKAVDKTNGRESLKRLLS